MIVSDHILLTMSIGVKLNPLHDHALLTSAKSGTFTVLEPFF